MKVSVCNSLHYIANYSSLLELTNCYHSYILNQNHQLMVIALEGYSAGHHKPLLLITLLEIDVTIKLKFSPLGLACFLHKLIITLMVIYNSYVHINVAMATIYYVSVKQLIAE